MKKFIFWSLAFIITVLAAVYQRKTGPTYPKEIKVNINDTTYKLKLVRSLSLDQKSEVKLGITDTTVEARLFYKRYRSSEKYLVTEFKYNNESGNEGFYAIVPQQPPAGKIQYFLEVTDSGGTKLFFDKEPVVIRFKGGVPAFILIPHILLMFLAMLLSTIAGLMAVTKYPLYRKYGVWTLAFFIVGGMILGPVVQYFAFGDLWTGIPFGWDLTDNKTLIAVLFWILAVYMNRKEDKPIYTAIAAIVLLLVYSIPHSLFGSELDYNTGQVTQGIILNLF